jgi:hypothetical protein
MGHFLFIRRAMSLSNKPPLITGSFMFIAIERPNDQSRRETSKLVRNETILKLWETIFEKDHMFNYSSFNKT